MCVCVRVHACVCMLARVIPRCNGIPILTCSCYIFAFFFSFSRVFSEGKQLKSSSTKWGHLHASTAPQGLVINDNSSPMINHF